MSLDRVNFQVPNRVDVQVRNRVDFQVPSGTNGLFDDDRLAYGEWWAWTQVISRAIWQASSRLGLGIMAAGFALAASLLFQSPAGALYGPMMVWVALALAIWFVLSAVLSSLRGH
jgi:hypothetical protein